MNLVSCGYHNSSDRMVIARCLGPDQFYLERVVFPFELLSFQCPPESELEIWTHGLGGPELVERIGTDALLIDTEGDGSVEQAPIAFGALQPAQREWQEAG